MPVLHFKLTFRIQNQWHALNLRPYSRIRNEQQEYFLGVKAAGA
jgi:hypothetical protein